MIEETKYNIVEKTVRILVATFLLLIVLLFIVLMLIYLSFAASYALGELLDSNVYGFLCTAGAYLLILIIIILNRKAWIEKPLVRFFTSILFD